MKYRSSFHFPFSIAILSGAAALIAHVGNLHAANLYWDANGATTGAGTAVTGNWGTSNFWNTDSTGGAGTFSTSIAATDTAVFSAGSDAVSGTITLNANTVVGGLIHEDGTISLVSSGSAKSLTVNSDVTFSRSIVIGTNTATTTVNLLLGSNSLTHTGGTLDIYGANTMSGAFLKGGNSFIGHASALGGGTVTIGDTAANSTYTMNIRTITFARPIVLDSGSFANTTTIQNTSFQNSIMQGAVTSAGSGAKTLNINSVATGGNGSITWTTGSINHTGVLNLQNTRNTGSGTNGAVTINSVIGGNVTDVNVSNTAGTGTQTVTLGGANTYSGNTTVNANANLILSAANVIPDGAGKGNFIVNGSVDARFSETVNGLSGSGTINRSIAGTTTLTVGGNDATSSWGGTIANGSGTLALTKIGAGTLTLTTANTYSGGTSLANNAGILAISHGSALGSGTVALTKAGLNGGTLELSGGITVANNFTFNSANLLATTGSAHIRNAAGDNEITGNLTLTNTGGNGTNIESASGTLTLSGAITSTVADNSRTISLGGAGEGIVTGSITNAPANSVSVSKAGSGTWTIASTTSSYTGTTTVSAGTLYVSGSLANTAVSVQAGATIGGTGALGGSLSFNAASFLDVLDFDDPLAVSGTITFGSGFGIANLTGIDWESLDLETPYTVLSTAQVFSESSIDNFGIANAAPVAAGRWAYFENGSLAVVVIPEPAAALSGSIGMLFLLRRRRDGITHSSRTR